MVADDNPKAVEGEAEELADLEVEGEDAEDVKGGRLSNANTYTGSTTISSGN